MRSWLRSRNVLAVPRRRSATELAAEMLPLVEELSFGLGDAAGRTSGCHDEIRVEGVAARFGLVGDDAKVAGDVCRRIGSAAKTLELRVPGVAASATEKHGLRK